MTSATATRVRPTAKGPAQIAAIVVSVFLIVIGIIGFIPGIVPHLDQITFAGPYSGAFVFNVFQTSVLQNIVHIVFGLAGFGAVGKRANATKYIAGMSFLFGCLWMYGLLFGNSTFGGNIFPFNPADFSFNIGLSIALGITALATSQLALFGSDWESDD
ncbi:DUF4383 domain-containing protein [Frondihabitans australicus]|uniref:Uncharacterized protein DUF4383 n=1 Tax=Frondihabitans australicus TaxID=386892 RepID=A0A495IJ15_9MICO|nr:DUF4383 domain-containing protein [Frondihabitans australicus]RKR75759.1 uncharacterized protein DUF4383 [Frondihabitans australicus]